MRLCEHHRIWTPEMFTRDHGDGCVWCELARLRARVAQLEGEIATPLRLRAQAMLNAWRVRQDDARPHGTDWRHARDVCEVLEELLAFNPPGGVTE